MSASVMTWIAGGAVVLGGILAWVLYRVPLHPARRREHLVTRVCERAFKDEAYRLIQLRVSPDEPSLIDLLPWPLGPSGIPRYYTYSIEGVEGGESPEPDVTGLSRSEVKLIHRYMRRSTGVAPHHGRRVIRSGQSPRPVS